MLKAGAGRRRRWLVSTPLTRSCPRRLLEGVPGLGGGSAVGESEGLGLVPIESVDDLATRILHQPGRKASWSRAGACLKRPVFLTAEGLDFFFPFHQ